MKRSIFLLFLTLGLPAFSQVSYGTKDNSTIAQLYNAFRKHIPCKDNVTDYKYTNIYYNANKKEIKIAITENPTRWNYEVDTVLTSIQRVCPECKLKALVDHGFKLRISRYRPPIKSNGWNQDAQSYEAIISPKEVNNFLHPVTPKMRAKDMLAIITGNTETPITIDSGYVLDGVDYSPKSNFLTFDFVLNDELWATISDTNLFTSKELRSWKMNDLYHDESFETIFTSEATVHFIWRNRTKTDSVDIFIAHWMWDSYAKTIEQEEESVDTLQMLSRDIIQSNAELPEAIDSVTTFTKIEFDTIHRTLTYYYEVTESTMLFLNSLPNKEEHLSEAITTNFDNSEDPDIKMMISFLAKRQFTMQFIYSTRLSHQSISITMKPEDFINQ